MLRAEALLRGRGRGWAGPDCSPPGNPVKGPHLAHIQRGACSQRRAGALLARKPAPGRSSHSLPAPPALTLGQLTLRRERGLCLPSPAHEALTSKGLEDTFPGYLRETSCSRPSPGQRRTTVDAQTFLRVGLRPELELTGGRREAVPRSSRAARAGNRLHSRQHPALLGRAQGRAGEGRGLCWTSMCKEQAARAAGEHSLGEGVLMWSVGGSEVLAPGGGRQRVPQDTEKGQLKQ